MQRHGICLAARLRVTDTTPDISALARLDRPKPRVLEFTVDGAQPWPVIPQHRERHVQIAEKAVGALVTLPVGTVETDCHMLQIIGPADLLDNIAKGRAVDLRQETWQDQFHWPVT